MKGYILLSLSLVISIILGSLQLQAQGWVNTFDLSVWEAGSQILSTDDGAMLAGHTKLGTDPSQNLSNAFISKLNLQGETEWTNVLGDGTKFQIVKDFIACSDGGYAICGYEISDGISQQILLIKLDALGNEEWSYYQDISQNPNSPELANDLLELEDGSIVMSGTYDAQTSPRIFLSTISANGTFISTQTVTDATGMELPAFSNSIVADSEGGFVIVGSKALSSSFQTGEKVAMALKIDADGNTLWIYDYEDLEYDFSDFNQIEMDEVGNLYSIGIKNSETVPFPLIQAFLVKLDIDATEIWRTERSISSDLSDGVLQNSETYDFFLNDDGSTVLTGRNENGQEREVLLVKFDSDGTEVWDNSIPFPTQTTYGVSIDGTSDNGFVIAGLSNSNDVSGNDILLIKTDSLGKIFTNELNGTIFNGSNCSPGSEILQATIIEASNEDQLFYAYSDENGMYSMDLDTANYGINFYPPSPYWQISECNEICSTDENACLDFSESNQTQTLDYFLEPLVECPYLEVGISTPFLRRCFSNIYTFQYCNNGTADAEFVYAELTFDPYLTVDSASVQWSEALENNMFVFDIGDVPVGVCEYIYIYVTVDCESTVLGQTHCVEAQIYPDSLCLEPDPEWDGSNLEIELNCLGDTVEMLLRNTGLSMDMPAPAVIMEDNIILAIEDFELDAGEELALYFPSSGSTFFFEVEQAPGNPTSLRTSGIIEGCGASSPEELTVGYYNTYPQYDSNPFYDSDCQANIGSFDPNDKKVSPEGITDEHFIRSNDVLEYTIRFQNTGTDTAFTVLIKDLISSHLDLSTIQTIASSHPYSFSITEERLVEWRFDNILLPDSSTNELESNGFVKFSIKQNEENEDGTAIQNTSSIYFDFNNPIVTNTVINTVNDAFFIPNETCESFMAMAEMDCGPGPFYEYYDLIIIMEGGDPGVNGYNIYNNTTNEFAATNVPGPGINIEQISNLNGYSYTVSVADNPNCFAVLDASLVDCRTTPIELLEFTVIPEKEGNFVKWTTASEYENDHFNILQSIDGRNFTKIGEVTGQGNSNRTINYDYIDQKIFDLTYYQLESVDHFNRIEKSNIISLRRNQQTSFGLHVHPNPVSQTAQIEIDPLFNLKTLKLIDVFGNIVHSFGPEETENRQLDFNSFAPGIYFIMIENQSGETQIQKVIKN